MCRNWLLSGIMLPASAVARPDVALLRRLTGAAAATLRRDGGFEPG